MALFDPRRSRAVVATVLAVLAAAAALNAGLAAVAPASRWFPDDEDTYDWLFLERAASNFSAARREPGPVGVVLGLSTALMSIDFARLTDEGPAGYRWVVANGFGGTAHKHAQFARLMEASRFRPEAVVIGMNPIMLASRLPAPAPAAGPPAAPAAEGGPVRRAIRAARGLAWVVDSRYPAKHVLRSAALAFKMRLLARLGAEPASASAPSASPWQAVDLDTTERMDLGLIEEDRRRFAAFGFFSPESYAPDSAPVRELVDAVRAARSGGARVVVVLLPEMREMRERTPAPARGLPARVLAAAFGPDAPPVLDLGDTVPDDQFLNLTHTNLQGKATFSSALARALRDALR